MATVSLAPASTVLGHPTRGGNVKIPYLVEYELNYATALTAKGSALASADVIECIRIPADTIVMKAGAQVKVAGNSTTLTLHVGTGADNDEWVASLDGKATAGTYGADLDAVPMYNTYGTTDTIDVTFATLTGTLSTGVVRVFALMLDVSDANAPGLALVGS